MNRQEILEAIKTLAQSQGMYGRLYNVLTNGTQTSENILKEMEGQNFGDVVDMVMWLEETC